MFPTDPSWPAIHLTVAGLTVRLFCDHHAIAAGLAARYRPFSPAILPNSLTSPDGSQSPRLDLWVRAGSGSEGDGLLGARLAFCGRQVSWDTPACQGIIDLQGGSGFLALRSPRRQENIEYFLRLAVALLAFDHGGLLFHAAGLVRSGAAYLFFGPSGSGKTTVARLSPHDLVLNDDLVILSPGENGWLVSATPFWNPTQVRPTPASAPLAGLFRLVQDRSVFLEKMSTGLALAEILASAPVISQDPGRSASLISRGRQILAAHSAYRLHFLPDDSFWPVVAQVEQF